MVIASDEIRKELAGLAHDAPTAAAYGAGIYDDAHAEATYAEMIDRGRAPPDLGAGDPPHVSDATTAVADAMADDAEAWTTALVLDMDAPLFVVTAAARRAIG